MAINFVKFLRGTHTAYNNLAEKDINTLYFISEPGATVGDLYLGNQLISGGSGSTGPVSLNQLTDIAFTTCKDKQVLLYNATTGKWENGFVSDIVDIMVGATATQAGAKGLVPAPAAGQQRRFLRGDGTWADPVQKDDNVFVDTATGDLTLVGFEAALEGAIPVKGSDGKLTWSNEYYTKTEVEALLNGHGLRRVVKESVDAIDVEADDAEAYIYMVRNDKTEGSNLYDEYMVIDGKLELISNGVFDGTGYVTETSLASELAGYVSLDKYNSEVGNIGDLVFNDDMVDPTIVKQINVLTERLTWEDMH